MSGSDSKFGIFVSHSHADNGFCQRLIHDLRQRYGEEAVWFDNAGGLAPGDEWWAKIRAELRNRPIFIVVLSPDAVSSPWVDDEITLAWSQRHSPGGKLIIPVIHQKCDLRDDISALRNRVSFLDSSAYDASLKKLLAQVEAFRQKQERATREQEARAQAARKRAQAAAPTTGAGSLGQRTLRASSRTVAVSVSVVLLLAVVAALALANRPVGGRTGNRATPLATPAPTSKPTPTLAQLFNEPVPGPCIYPDAWIVGQSVVASEAEISSLGGPGAFVCKADAVELATYARSAGNYGYVDMYLQLPTGAIPIKHGYQITVVGWPPHVAGHMDIVIDSVTLTFQNKGQNGQVLKISYCPTSSGTQASIDKVFPSSFDIQAQTDGQTEKLSVNGSVVASCSNLGNSGFFSIDYYADGADSTKISSLSLKNFIITNLS